MNSTDACETCGRYLYGPREAETHAQRDRLLETSLKLQEQCERDARVMAELKDERNTLRASNLHLHAEREMLWNALEESVLALERYPDIKPMEAASIAVKGRLALCNRAPK